ncbi:hypothetical protein [Streptomyces diastatochromogenes]|nr:hypothetical protein [Streptomyces diastatochromogenes]
MTHLRFLVLCAALALGAAAPAAGASPAHPVMGGSTLACTGRVDPARPLVLDPAVRARPQRLSLEGTVLLDRCRTGAGDRVRRRSARVRVSGSGTVSCTGWSGLTGRARVEWFAGDNRTGRRLGTSSVVQSGRNSGGMSAALPRGRVTSGPLTGARVDSGVTYGLSALRCASQGVRSVSGPVWVRFTGATVS